MTENEIERMLTRTLERRTAVRVPAGFAARVARAVPVRTAPRQGASVTRVMTVVAGVVSTAGLFAVAARVGTQAESWGFVVEMLLVAQLAGLGYGWVRMRDAGL